MNGFNVLEKPVANNVMFDPIAFKAQFPLFKQSDNSALVYLDNAATTQKPQVVIDAITEYYLCQNASAHRASHRLGRNVTRMIERTRLKAAQFVGASAETIFFTSGATDGLNHVASMLAGTLEPGDEVIVSMAEHHANVLPWILLSQTHGIILRYLPSDSSGVPDVSVLPDILNARTRVVSLTAASNALGFELPLAQVGQHLKHHPAQFIVDAAQWMAHRSVSVDQLGCDFLVCSAHKFYGPAGIGWVYGRKDALAALSPGYIGGGVVEDVQLFDYKLIDGPQRFEAGSPNGSAIAGLEACLDWWSQLDRPAIQAYEKSLMVYAHERLADIKSIMLLSCPDNNVGVLSFMIKPQLSDGSSNMSSYDLAQWLDQADIAVRSGHHCAQPLHDQLSVDGSIRLSFAAYNTTGDVDRCVTEIVACFANDQRLAVNEAVASADWVNTHSGHHDGEQDDTFDRHTALNLYDLSSVDLNALAEIDNGQQRYKKIMRYAALIPAQASIRQPQHLVTGCETQVWLHGYRYHGLMYFQLDSDSRIIRGLGVLLLKHIQAQAPQDILMLNVDDMFNRYGLGQQLTPSRGNGFRAMISRVQALAKPAG